MLFTYRLPHPSAHARIPRKILAVALTTLFAGTVSAQSQPDVTRGGASAATFTRMFPFLPPFAQPRDDVRQALESLGRKGGLLDAQDNLTDPVKSVTEPLVFSPNNPDNPNMTAGVTFLGQFLDHDLTFDEKSPLRKPAQPARTVNTRTAALDLDTVYGGGPARNPNLYDRSSGLIKFRIDTIAGAEAVSRNGAPRSDLPRDANNTAIIGDPRNDENAIISQLHVAMLKLHNVVTDRLRADPANATKSAAQIFAEAQRSVRWHYQWIVVNEFLPTIIGRGRVDQLLRRPPNLSVARTPIEFSVAAYRFGHSMVRPSYRLNFGPNADAPFFAFIFDDNQSPTAADPNDLRGGKRAPRRFVDWQTFFDFGDGNVRRNKKIDTKLSTVLMELPGLKGPAPGLPSDGVQSLPSRNLMRHVNFGLPSGQAIARTLRVPALSAAQLSELKPLGLDQSTPLWFYILKEGELMEGGLRMGPVGAHIVGSTFISLLKLDRTSYLGVRPGWRPTLPSARAGDFRMTDLLRLAGVVPPL